MGHVAQVVLMSRDTKGAILALVLAIWGLLWMQLRHQADHHAETSPPGLGTAATDTGPRPWGRR